jgi:hypothetical protein
MVRKDEAEAEFRKTKTLTKAANDSVSQKIDNAHEKTKPTEGPAVVPADK